MVHCRRPHRSVLLYGFLVSGFYGLVARNHDVAELIRSIEQSSRVASSTNGDNGSVNNNSSDHHSFRGDSDQNGTRFFQENLELGTLIGAGDVSFAFQARYENRTVIAKVASDKDLYYSDIEIEIFHELNAAPSIPNIPQLQLAIRSMPNPFVIDPNLNTSISYLVDTFGFERSGADKLVMKRRISVMVMDLLEGYQQPTDLEEVQRLMKSLLKTMEFVHSRNIMHCDLHLNNYHWDGEDVYLFDWNGAFKYEPNKIWIHYPRTPRHLFPPEAIHNTSAVHTSVYAFDVYSIGRIMKKLLDRCCGIHLEMLQDAALKILKDKESGKSNSNSNNEETVSTLDGAIAYDLVTLMMIADPYERPSTTQALQHSFFQRDLPRRNKNIIKK